MVYAGRKRARLLLLLLLFSGFAIHSQAIVTAAQFFNTVSSYYATFKDYEVDIDINANKTLMNCHASYKKPSLLRMDFTKPQSQVILFNGDMLTIYLPKVSSVLQQAVNNDKKETLSTPEGLTLLSRYYIVSYEIGQEPVPLDAANSENVIKLVFTRRNSIEAFRAIKMAIDANTNLIRRLEATTTKGEVFTFDFFDYKLNTGIADARFIYDAPSSANNFNNFLYSE